MPAPKSSGSSRPSKRTSANRSRAGAPQTTRSKASTGSRSKAPTGSRSKAATGSRSKARAGTRSASSQASTAKRRSSRAARAGGVVADGLSSLVEQLTNRIIKPLDLVMLSRERIQDTLDEAAERGRVTRTDANELVAELVRRGRQQTDELLDDAERLLGRGRDQLGSAGKRARLTEPVDRLVRSADRARRTVSVGGSFPILGYDDLTAGQVQDRLSDLSPADLRKVREYERRHANRKSVLAAIERQLA